MIERYTDLFDFEIGLLPFYYGYYVNRQIKVELSFGNTKGERFSIQSILVVCICIQTQLGYAYYGKRTLL